MNGNEPIEYKSEPAEEIEKPKEAKIKSSLKKKMKRKKKGVDPIERYKLMRAKNTQMNEQANDTHYGSVGASPGLTE